MLPRHGPQPHEIVSERFACLLGDVGRLPAQRQVNGYQVTLYCWGLRQFGGQDVWYVALAAPQTPEIVEDAACQNHVCGNVGVKLHIPKKAVEAV